MVKGTSAYGRCTVFFDVETNGCSFGGENRLRLTVAFAWCSVTDCLYSYVEDELGYLAALLDTADTIIAHNSSFDLGVMALYFNAERVSRWRACVLDPFEVIRRKEGTWAGLGAICEVNHRPTKTGTGLEAITLWNEGKIAELAAYCAMDVLIMVRLLEVGDPDLDSWFWYCQKRHNLDTKSQQHLRANRVNKRTWEIAMGEAGSFPPDFIEVCPCIKKAQQIAAERLQPKTVDPS